MKVQHGEEVEGTNPHLFLFNYSICIKQLNEHIKRSVLKWSW